MNQFNREDFIDYEPEFVIEVANPGSALRRQTPDNPRNLPCPTCEQPNRLTPQDVSLGYQCDACADMSEFGGY